MDQRIEPLRKKLAEFYSGAKSLSDTEQLNDLWNQGKEFYRVYRDDSAERRWLNGLFRTLKEWGYVEGESPTPPTPPRLRVYRDGMPGIAPFFVGREQQKQQLTAWLADPQSRIVQITGAGGYGKTQLVNNWLQSFTDPPSQGGSAPFDAIFCWCFYSVPGRVVMFNDFLTEAIEFFERFTGRRNLVLGERRPDYLADLVATGKHLVVLDGLEALQKKPKYDDDPQRRPGEIRDRYVQMEQFLKAFTKRTGGKLVVTSRQKLKEFVNRPTIKDLELQGITESEGVEILKRLRVNGSERELKAIVTSLSGHPLSLELMGLALAWHHKGVASQYRRVQLMTDAKLATDDALEDNDVIASYARWLQEGPEIELLRLVGFFFKRQIPLKDLKVLLWCEAIRPVMPELWQKVQGGEDGDLNWQAIIDALWLLQDSLLLLSNLQRDYVLAGELESRLVYDAHPLLRDYYAEEIQRREEGRYWRAGQAALFEYYSKMIPGAATSAEDASVLYEAIGYACQAGKYREAFEVYWRRIHHNDSLFDNQVWHGWYRLGLYSADLGALGWFYSEPWEKLQPGADAALNPEQKIMLRYATAECLRTQGLAREAGHPIAAARHLLTSPTSLQTDRLVLSAIVVGWECERQLLQGNFVKAKKAGEQALELANRSGDPRQILSKHGRLGDLYLQMGKWKKAQSYFTDVRSHHREYLKQNTALPEDYPIAGFTGFLYGDFVLTRAEIVLGKWDPKKKYLRGHARSKKRAQEELRAVQEESLRVAGLKDRISLYDTALHDLLAQRAQAIHNIALTGAEGQPDLDVHLDVNRNLRELEKQFDQVARGELPRLLVKRAKVLRRLREMGQKEVTEDGDLLLAAARCLDQADDIATYGKMKLYKADVLLERTKVFLCQAKHSDSPESATKARENAEACFKKARRFIRDLKYRKRYPELQQVALLFKR